MVTTSRDNGVGGGGGVPSRDRVVQVMGNEYNY